MVPSVVFLHRPGSKGRATPSLAPAGCSNSPQLSQVSSGTSKDSLGSIRSAATGENTLCDSCCSKDDSDEGLCYSCHGEGLRLEAHACAAANVDPWSSDFGSSSHDGAPFRSVFGKLSSDFLRPCLNRENSSVSLGKTSSISAELDVLTYSTNDCSERGQAGPQDDRTLGQLSPSACWRAIEDDFGEIDGGFEFQTQRKIALLALEGPHRTR